MVSLSRLYEDFPRSNIITTGNLDAEVLPGRFIVAKFDIANVTEHFLSIQIVSLFPFSSVYNSHSSTPRS